MTEENIHIPLRSGKKVAGLIRKPDELGKFPVVVFVSGLGMDMHEWINSNDEISKHLVNKGILTVQFNFSVVGTNRELGLNDRTTELEDIIRWTSNHTNVESSRLGIHATSYGVPTTLLLSQLPKSFCLVAGVHFLHKSITKVFEERGVKINYQGDTAMPRSSGQTTTVGKEFWESIEKYDPLEVVKSIKIPVFMVHGDKDTKVETSDVQKVFDAIPSEGKRLKIFIDGDHGIADVPRRMRDEFLKEVTEWFVQTL